MSTYTFTTLSDPSAVYGTYVTGINGKGQIVGYWVDADGAKNGFLDSGGSFTTILGTQTYITGASYTVTNLVPQGINDEGEIVGYFFSQTPAIEDGFINSFVYDSNKSFYDFAIGSVNGGDFEPTWANGINNQGQIVGYENSTSISGFDGGNLTGPYFEGGNYYALQPQTALNYPGAQSTVAEGINSLGEVVGNWIGTDPNVPGVTSHGFIYVNGVWLHLDDPSGVNGTFAQGINNAGVIVGYYLDGNSIVHGFSYNQPAGVYTTIEAPGSTSTYLYGINDAGDIVGTYSDSAGDIDGFELTVSGSAVPYDFSGTGTSAILWQNGSTDQVAIWEMNGGTAAAYTTVGTAPSGWQIAGSGDFNGDGMADILWQNQSSGQAAIWVMNGASATSYSTIDGIPSGWQVAGMGDFNGDGDADILWRNLSTTQIAIWQMNAATPASETIIGTAPSAWKVGGVADFNGDGDADILWQNGSTGQIAIWEMNGASASAYNTIGTAPTGWQVAGVGDFAGNGTQDILFQNASTDQLAVWQTNGASLTGSAIIANNVPFSSGWQIAAVGDYTGTGADSILWQNATTGQAALWQTNGSSLTSTNIIASGVSSGWQVAHNPVLAA